MKTIGSILLLALGLVGCASPRYQVAVTAVETPNGPPVWLAVRVDQQTGATSYYYHQSSSPLYEGEWHPMSEGAKASKP